MARQRYDNDETIDDLECSYGPDFETEMFDDTCVDELRDTSSTLAAWQRIELRKESAWLRGQLVDWDDWDEYFDSH